MDGINGIDYAHKARFNWIAMIRLPEFVTHEHSRGPAGILGQAPGGRRRLRVPVRVRRGDGGTGHAPWPL